jgi:transposase InsO family protein
MVHQATGSNQVWSWGISWLPTTMRGAYLYLYLIMDVWSRCIVGWQIAERECAGVAAGVCQESCVRAGLITH